MTKFLVFCLLLSSASVFVSCSVQLQQICSGETFKVDGPGHEQVLINAVHKQNTSFTFPPFKYYLIDDHCDSCPFNDESNRHKATLLKTEYNELIMKYYSESYMNEYEQHEDFDDLYHAVVEFLPDFISRMEEIKSAEGNNRCTSELETKIKRGELFVNTLINYLNTGFQDSESEEAVPRKADELNKLQSIISKFDPDAKQKFFFASDPIEKIYDQALHQKKKFVLNRASKFFFDKNSNGTFFYHIFLPFHTKGEYDPTEDCISIHSLPRWFFNAYLKDRGFIED